MDQLIILQSLREEDFLLKTLQQLQREFSRIGIDFPELSTTTSFDEAQQEVQLILNTIIHDNPESLPHLLYIIDLSEIKVRKLIDRSENSANDLAYAILLRCAEKVYWKKKFQ